jgi:hypothetical protein
MLGLLLLQKNKNSYYQFSSSPLKLLFFRRIAVFLFKTASIFSYFAVKKNLQAHNIGPRSVRSTFQDVSENP